MNTWYISGIFWFPVDCVYTKIIEPTIIIFHLHSCNKTGLAIAKTRRFEEKKFKINVDFCSRRG